MIEGMSVVMPYTAWCPMVNPLHMCVYVTFVYKNDLMK